VSWWIKRKKNPELCPQIKRPSAFGATWKEWWVKSQPPWRECEALIKVLPADADWEPISRGGANGFGLVVMALSWWIQSAKGDEELDVDLRSAIDDVYWVVLQLTHVGTVALVDGEKRAREDDADERPAIKKYVVHILS
jgi:hypothetical protein